MAFKPHRPIRVGTVKTMTDADGNVPKSAIKKDSSPTVGESAPMTSGSALDHDGDGRRAKGAAKKARK